MAVQEYRRRCKVCGKIWCYTEADIKETVDNATTGLLLTVGSLANFVGGSEYRAFEMQKSADRRSEKTKVYWTCPECNSRDIEPYYTEEDKIRMAEEEKRAVEEAKRKEEEERRIKEEQRNREIRKKELKEAYWAEHKAEKEVLIEKREHAKKKIKELGMFAKKERQELENMIKAIDYELEKERG